MKITYQRTIIEKRELPTLEKVYARKIIQRTVLFFELRLQEIKNSSSSSLSQTNLSIHAQVELEEVEKKGIERGVEGMEWMSSIVHSRGLEFQPPWCFFYSLSTSSFATICFLFGLLLGVVFKQCA